MGFAKKRSISKAAHRQNYDALCYHLYFFFFTYHMLAHLTHTKSH